MKFQEKVRDFVFEVFVEMIFDRDNRLIDQLFQGAQRKRGQYLRELKRWMTRHGIEWNHHHSQRVTTGRAMRAGWRTSSDTTADFEALRIDGPYRNLPAPVAFETKFVTDPASIAYRAWKYVYEAKARGYGGCVICLFDALGHTDWREVKKLEAELNEYLPTDLLSFEEYTGRRIHNRTYRMLYRYWKMSRLQLQPQLYREFSNEKRLTAFNDCITGQQVTLLAGAGTTIAAGGPSWLTLIDRLWQAELRGRYAYPNITPEAAHAEVNNVLGDSVLVQARMLRRISGPGFMHKIRRQVYSGLNHDASTPQAFARLALRLYHAQQLDRIITFNYDDLIEEAITALGEQSVPHYSERRTRESGLVVDHVHGYLPPPPQDITPEQAASVVFDEGTYHSRFNQPGHWTNVTLTDALQNSVCVFVGFSMTDPNVRRLLELQKRPGETPHFILLKLPDLRLEDAELQLTRAQLVAAQEDLMRELGLNVLWYETFDDLPVMLDLLSPLSVLPFSEPA
ncbi:SIR2 family protein (plasmid) [Deinococcus sp. PESE-38]